MKTYALTQPQTTNTIINPQKTIKPIKTNSWPTIPQLYVNGEFIGGFDIMKDMHNSEEFVGVLEEAGIESALKNI